MTIWDNTHDLIQLIEMCIYLPINILLCIPAIAVYFGREAYLLFHLITGFKLVPKGQRIDRDTIRHRGALYLFLHVYVIYALWNVSTYIPLFFLQSLPCCCFIYESLSPCIYIYVT